MKKKENQKEIECRYCGYKWIPRAEKPKTCPRCKRYDYLKEEKKE